MKRFTINHSLRVSCSILSQVRAFGHHEQFLNDGGRRQEFDVKMTVEGACCVQQDVLAPVLG